MNFRAEIPGHHTRRRARHNSRWHGFDRRVVSARRRLSDRRTLAPRRCALRRAPQRPLRLPLCQRSHVGIAPGRHLDLRARSHATVASSVWVSTSSLTVAARAPNGDTFITAILRPSLSSLLHSYHENSSRNFSSFIFPRLFFLFFFFSVPMTTPLSNVTPDYHTPRERDCGDFKIRQRLILQKIPQTKCR